MLSDEEILSQWAEDVVPDLAILAGSYFGPSIGYETKPDELLIYGSPYISVLVDGRGPTKQGAAKGNPTLQQRILEWVNRKGIAGGQDKNGKRITAEALSWAISKSIHRKGTLLYQRGGGNNIFDTVLTASRLTTLEAMFSEKYANQIESSVLRELNTLIK